MVEVQPLSTLVLGDLLPSGDKITALTKLFSSPQPWVLAGDT